LNKVVVNVDIDLFKKNFNFLKKNNDKTLILVKLYKTLIW